MKHKIVFRGKSLDNNKWYNGDLRQFSDRKVFIAYKNFAMVRVGPDSVGQYTGLKDKNGKEIFEGDILAHDRKVIGHVVGGVRGYCYDVIYKNPRYDPRWSLYGTVVNDYKGNVEVVGNVIDNHDLLIS